MKIGINSSYLKYLYNSYRLLLTIVAQIYVTPSLLLLGLIVSATAANSMIFFAGAETRILYSELIIIASASIAAFLGVLLAYRQILHNRSHSKMYISLAIGLVLWLSADIIWASYELVFHVAAPIPSLSDILWLAGYPFFAYNLIATYRQFHNKFNNNRVLLASIIGNVIFIVYLASLTIGLSDFSSQAGVLMFAVLIAYPMMNALLTIPALSILIGLWKERPWSIPWTFKSLSLFCIVITDSWFAFIILSGLYEQVWLSSMFFGAEYLILAGGLLWFNKYLAIYKNQGTASTTNTSQDHLKITDGFHKRNTPNRIQYLQVLVAVILVGGTLSYGFMTSGATESTKYFGPVEGSNTILIGALLPLTGTSSSTGEEVDAALRLAVDDVNN
jgi:hypothetical protein